MSNNRQDGLIRTADNKPLSPQQSEQAKQEWNSMSMDQKQQAITQAATNPKAAAQVAAGIAQGDIKPNQAGGVDLVSKGTAPTTTPVSLAPNAQQPVSQLMSNNRQDGLIRTADTASAGITTQSQVQAQISHSAPSGATGGAGNIVAAMNVKPPRSTQAYSRVATKSGDIVESWQTAVTGGGSITHTLTSSPSGQQTLMTNGLDSDGKNINMVSNYSSSGRLIDRTANTVDASGSKVTTFERFNNSGNLQQTSQKIERVNGAAETISHAVGNDGAVTSKVEGSSKVGSYSIVEKSNANGEVTSRVQTDVRGGVRNVVQDSFAGQGQVQRTKTFNNGDQETAIINKSMGAPQVDSIKYSAGFRSFAEQSNQMMSEQTSSMRHERLDAAKAIELVVKAEGSGEHTSNRSNNNLESATANTVNVNTGNAVNTAPKSDTSVANAFLGDLQNDASNNSDDLNETNNAQSQSTTSKDRE